MSQFQGRCLCGSVAFTLTGPLRPIVACHCRQCARWTGHAVYATAVSADRFKLDAGEAQLGWFRASDTAARGYCKGCGSPLFWKPDHGRHISVLAGAIDPPTGLAVSDHIYTEFKSDYFDLPDGVPCHAGDIP